MLTVKQITLSGIEFLWEATNVNFQPGRNFAKGSDEPAVPASRQDAVFINVAGGERVEIHGGTVFVMNDHGKTVSRYDLGASEIPLMCGPFGDDAGGGVNPHLTAHLTKTAAERQSVPMPQAA